jgi:hypothetical protein
MCYSSTPMETILEKLSIVDSGKSNVNHLVVVALGSHGHINQSFVTIASTVPINRDGIAAAVDRMFKLYFLLNTEYPPECKQILHFLQRTIYGICDELKLSRAGSDLFLFIQNKKSQGVQRTLQDLIVYMHKNCKVCGFTDKLILSRAASNVFYLFVHNEITRRS